MFLLSAAEQEMIAAQTWTKTERFLTRKKHEDEVKKEETLTSMSWEEMLKHRRKSRNTANQATVYCHQQSLP